MNLSMGYLPCIARKQGSIRKRGRTYQVRVYAGTDPLTGRDNYLSETAPDEKTAQRALRRLLTQVDEQSDARTKATFGELLDAWLAVHEVDESTLADHEANVRRYIKPALGSMSVGRLTLQMLEELYAELRQCRARCRGRPFIEHRVDGQHECHTVRHRRPPGRPPAGNRNHDCAKAGCVVIDCRPHVCQPVSPAKVRKIHFTISAALTAGVRWDWIKSNPADVARKPRQTPPQPSPASPDEAARIVAAAWEQDEAWGTLVWLTTVTGMRRGELLALRWDDVDLAGGMLEIRRNYVWTNGRGVEKDTKTHQMRRIALDPETVELLRAHP